MAKISGILPESHAALIGNVADAWSQFEFEIDRGIWELTDSEQMYVACLTAQLISIHPRMKAFIALSEVRGATSYTLNGLKTFYGKTASGLSERRNRCLHDSRGVDRTTGIVHRLEITAKPTHHFGYEPEPGEGLEDFVKEIDAATAKFVELRNKAIREVQETPSASRPPLVRITELPEIRQGPPSEEIEPPLPPESSQE